MHVRLDVGASLPATWTPVASKLARTSAQYRETDELAGGRWIPAFPGMTGRGLARLG